MTPSSVGVGPRREFGPGMTRVFCFPADDMISVIIMTSFRAKSTATIVGWGCCRVRARLREYG